jgi:alpha-tubulin suppressor-like RCC1 family protein
VFGQLGDGTQNWSTTPIQVAGLTAGVQAVSSGIDHACAMKTTDNVVCWGYNGGGQVGDGTEIDRWIPVPVIGLP